MTQVTIIGRLAKDVELRFTANGKAVAALTVAENHRKKDAAGNWIDGTVTWWDCTLWDKAAENAANDLQKGDRLIVTGDTYTEEFTRKDGTEGKALRVRAEEVARSVRFSSASGSAPRSTTTSDDPWS